MNDVSFKFYTNGHDILQGMLDEIASATESIELEQFSFHDDAIGRRFLELFEKKLHEGVRIRIIADSMNSQPLFQSPYVGELEKQGLEIMQFNPVSFVSPKQAFFRMHKKILVVDSKIAWVGGLGLKKKFADFRDTQVRLTGIIVDRIREAFEIIWQNQIPSKIQEVGSENHFKFLVNYNGFEKKEIYEWMRSSIISAKKHIYITTSYFYPDRNFFQLILNKAREGLDIKLILRGKNDEFATIRFSASFFSEALSSGIEIYRYKPAIMHAKIMIIDEAATVGSSNLDKFSSYYNLEANVASTDPVFVNELKNQFFADLRQSHKLTLKEWKLRPVFERFLEVVAWPFHNYL